MSGYLTILPFRDIVKEHFSRRSSVNTSYSLRAFARDLDVNPGNLSRFFRGEANFSLDMARKIADTLDLSGQERITYVEPASEVELPSYSESVSKEMDTYVLGLIRIMKNLRDFEPTKSYFKRKLPEYRDNLDEILEKLESVGLIEINGEEIIIKKIEAASVVHSKERNLRSKVLHKQSVVNKCLEVAERDDRSKDLQLGALMVFAKEDYPQAKDDIQKFLREFSAKYAKSCLDSQNSIYQFFLSFHQLAESEA